MNWRGMNGNGAGLTQCIMIEGISPHPVPLPMGEGTVLQPLCRRPFSHGEKDRMRGDALSAGHVLTAWYEGRACQ